MSICVLHIYFTFYINLTEIQSKLCYLRNNCTIFEQLPSSVGDLTVKNAVFLCDA
jgi:hypothetical protein